MIEAQNGQNGLNELPLIKHPPICPSSAFSPVSTLSRAPPSRLATVIETIVSVFKELLEFFSGIWNDIKDAIKAEFQESETKTQDIFELSSFQKCATPKTTPSQRNGPKYHFGPAGKAISMLCKQHEAIHTVETNGFGQLSFNTFIDSFWELQRTSLKCNLYTMTMPTPLPGEIKEQFDVQKRNAEGLIDKLTQYAKVHRATLQANSLLLHNQLRTGDGDRTFYRRAEVVFRAVGLPFYSLVHHPQTNFVSFPRGIRNGKNFCYRNAALQALLAFPNFVEKACGPIAAQRAQESQKEYLQRLIITSSFKNFIEMYMSGGPHNQAALDLSEAISISGKDRDFTEEFEKQHDAQQFLSLILEQLAITFKTQTILQGSAKLSNGALEEFKNTSSKEEGSTLSIPMQLNKTDSLEELLALHLSEEIDDKTTPYIYTSQGNEKISVTRYRKETQLIGPPPPMIVIHLKRFAWGEDDSISKINLPIALPTDDILDLSYAFQTPQAASYRLTSVIEHCGSNAYCGHYISYVRKGDEWYECNDSSVRKINRDQVPSSAAYCLLWELCGNVSSEVCHG